MSLRKGFLIALIILAHISCFVLFFLTGVMMTLQYIIAPRYEWDVEKEQPHYVEPVSWCPPSTNDLTDLVISKTMSRSEVKNQTLTHGSAILRNVIELSTMKELRSFVLQKNIRSKGRQYVHNGEHRTKIKLSHHEAGALMKQFASNPVIRSLMEDMLGPGATLASMDVITSYYGAVKQPWHRDNEPSKINYPTRFVKEVSFTIPLQDTTADMGATAICPGTHLCNAPRLEEYGGEDGNDDNDDDLLTVTISKEVSSNGYSPLTKQYRQLWNSSKQLQQEYRSYEKWMKKELPFCKLRAELNAGDVFLYDTDMYHRGEAHVDPQGADRVLLFLTFVESRTDVSDQRFYPFAAQYIMGWDSYGHTIDDFTNTEDWRPWQSLIGNLGAYAWHYASFGGVLSWQGNDHQTRRRVPWTIYDFCAVIWTDESEHNDILVEDDWLTAKYVQEKTFELMDVSKTIMIIYQQIWAIFLFAKGVLPKVFGILVIGGSIIASSYHFWESTKIKHDYDDDYEEMDSDVEDFPILNMADMMWPVGLLLLIRTLKKLLRQQKVKKI